MTRSEIIRECAAALLEHLQEWPRAGEGDIVEACHRAWEAAAQEEDGPARFIAALEVFAGLVKE